MKYAVEFRLGILKSIKHFPKRELLRIKKKIDELSDTLPDPATTKLQGDNNFHKVRIANYRIVYEIHGDRLVILVVKIDHRKDVYKNLP
jgi:mRNA interferase RelE/StbE